ncbi:MAG: U32 family peptidase C-terminal domain-containing protein, partial [SAR324 cluster bacterium]|nr:U32 family peptidase C-terminal domain-containing protein [SAR324 cluster bacterium]
DGEVVGYVLEVASREYMTVASRRSFARGDEMILITPEGKRIPFVVEDLRNWEQQEVEAAEVGGLWLLPHERSATAQSLLYFAEFFSDGD